MKALAIVALTLWPLAARAVSINDVPMDRFWSCETNTGSTTYLSAVFRATSTPVVMQNAFSQVLAQKYGYSGRVDCPGADADQVTIAKIEADQKNRIAQLRGVGRTVVETGWAFGAATTTVPYFCYGSVTVQQAGHATPLFIMTDTFRVAGSSDRPTIVGTWSNYVKGLHPGFAFSAQDCVLVPADESAATTLRQNAIAQHHVDGMQVVKDSWTFTGQPPPEDNRAAYFCEAASGDHKTIYLSGVELAGAGFDQTAASHAWGTYITKTLGPAFAQAACESGPMSSQQRTRAGRIELQRGSAGYTANEIDWKYAAGGAAVTPHAPSPQATTAQAGAAQAGAAQAGTAPPSASAPATSPAVAPATAASPATTTHAAAPASTPAAATPAAPVTAQAHGATSPPPPSAAPPHAKNPWVCQADAYVAAKRTHYISAPFDSDETREDLVPAWRAHLVSAYQLPGQVVAHCGRLPKPSEDALEAALAKNPNVPLVHDRWQP